MQRIFSIFYAKWKKTGKSGGKVFRAGKIADGIESSCPIVNNQNFLLPTKGGVQSSNDKHHQQDVFVLSGGSVVLSVNSIYIGQQFIRWKQQHTTMPTVL